MTSMNQEQARFNMVEQQVRTWDVLNPIVLDVLHNVPREKFVPDAYSGLAYADTEISLGHGQLMDKPLISARLLQELDVQAGDKVLEIGTGSGYLTALLAQLASHVVSIEKNATFTENACRALKELNVENTTLITGDAIDGCNENAPYDCIACSASFPEQVPEALLTNLKIGGRMFAIIGQSPLMEATLITRVSETAWEHNVLFETETPSLLGLTATEKFVL